MTLLRPFFLLLGRASVFWLSALGLLIILLFLAGAAEPDTRVHAYLDAVFLGAFAVPLYAGWLVGSVIQEFQHTSFAATLPGVRFRVGIGFLALGLILTTVVLGAIALSSATAPPFLVLFVVGLCGYALGAILIDPLSDWLTALNIVLVLFVVAASRELARAAGARPWMTVAIAIAIGAACSSRLFARATFRGKPFRATSPLPGHFALERGREVSMRREIANRPAAVWRADYRGSDPWRWVRAAVEEVRALRGWKASLRAIGRAWGLGLLILIQAAIDKGDMRYGEYMANSIYDALFGSPHQLPFGEHGGPFPLVMMVIALVGVLTTLFAPVALSDSIAYPLSRRDRARVLFRGGLIDVAALLFVGGPCLFAIGQIAGSLAGYGIRLDFVPFFFRVLMITVILMPLAHWGRLKLRAATRRRAENTLVGVIFGITGFVAAVGAWTFVSPRMFTLPVVELATLAAGLLISQWIYRNGLMNYYRTADLA